MKFPIKSLGVNPEFVVIQSDTAFVATVTFCSFWEFRVELSALYSVVLSADICSTLKFGVGVAPVRPPVYIVLITRGMVESGGALILVVPCIGRALVVPALLVAVIPIT